VRRAGKIIGPLSSRVVRRHLTSGSLKPHDEVSQGRSSWQRLADVAELIPPEYRDADGRLAPGAEAEFVKVKQAARWIDRNREEDGEVQEKNLIKQVERTSRERRRVPWVTLALSLLLAVAGVLLVYLLQSDERPREPDCGAVAAPGVNWESCVKLSAQLDDARLQGANLRNARLTEARLRRADLAQSALDYADLARADLSFADLSGASLKGAALQGSDLTSADLSGADLSFADLSGARIGGAKLEQVNLSSAIWLDGLPCVKGSSGGCYRASR
jgi:hypothetical protein